VEQALEGIGFAQEKRPFRSHVTLGRVKRGNCDLTEIADLRADQSFGTSTVGEVVLYESRLHRSGAEYIARARVALSGVERPAATASAAAPAADDPPKTGEQPAKKTDGDQNAPKNEDNPVRDSS
jgi:hypothetical protein